MTDIAWSLINLVLGFFCMWTLSRRWEQSPDWLNVAVLIAAGLNFLAPMLAFLRWATAN